MSVWNKIYALRAQFIVNSLTSGSAHTHTNTHTHRHSSFRCCAHIHTSEQCACAALSFHFSKERFCSVGFSVRCIVCRFDNDIRSFFRVLTFGRHGQTIRTCFSTPMSRFCEPHNILLLPIYSVVEQLSVQCVRLELENGNIIENFGISLNQGCTVAPDAWNGFLMLFLFRCCKPSSFIWLSFSLLAVLAMAVGYTHTQTHFLAYISFRFIFNLIPQFFIILLISDRLIPIHSRSFWWNRDCVTIFFRCSLVWWVLFTPIITLTFHSIIICGGQKTTSIAIPISLALKLIECKQWLRLEMQIFW